MSQLNAGSSRIAFVYIGSTRISKIYVGSNLVFTSDSPRMDFQIDSSNANSFNASKIIQYMTNAGTSVVVDGITHTIHTSTSAANTLTNNSNSNKYTFSWAASSASRYVVKKIAADKQGYLYVQFKQGTTNSSKDGVARIQFQSNGTYKLIKNYLA